MTHLAEIRVPEPQNNPKNNSTNFLRVLNIFKHFYVVTFLSIFLLGGLGLEIM